MRFAACLSPVGAEGLFGGKCTLPRSSSSNGASRMPGTKRKPSVGSVPEISAIEVTCTYHVVHMALTGDTVIAIADSGLPTTFVPGRNLIFFAFAGALAYRRGVKHLVAGMCETDYSGYPDCRDDTVKAMQLALNLGMERRFVLHTPLMWVDKAETFALAQELGGDALVDLLVEETHSCYLGERTRRHVWGFGCR